MAQLPIRALTFYKQGIGSFQRRGTLSEPSATLMVARASLNDVLKSLDIVVHQGGPLLSVDYETPTDRAQIDADGAWSMQCVSQPDADQHRRRDDNLGWNTGTVTPPMA